MTDKSQCIRVIVQTSDANMAANVGGHVAQEFKTFIVHAPFLVRFLSEKTNSLVNRSVIGIELIDMTPEPTT